MVWLNLYDLSKNGLVEAMNSALPLGAGGIFHMGVQVLRKEYSYGACPAGTGVHSFTPGGDPGHRFRESVPLGATRLSEKEADEAIRRLAGKWQGKDYHWARRNCWHFAKALAAELGVGPVPAWIDDLSQVVRAIASPFEATMKAMEAVTLPCRSCKPKVSVQTLGSEMHGYAPTEDMLEVC